MPLFWMKAKLHFVFSITIVFSCFYGFSQEDYWKTSSSRTRQTAVSTNQNYQVLELNEAVFKKRLIAASKNQDNVIYFPYATDSFDGFQIKETPVLHQDLAKRFPQIKSFTGWNAQRTKKARFSFSHGGLQVMMVDFVKGQTSFIEKLSANGNSYKVFVGSNSVARTPFECKTPELPLSKIGASSLALIDDQTLRKFRIAVAVTGEYTNYHGGTVVDALAAINATLTRVNEVFETDLGVTLELIATNDQIVFTDAATDPFTTSLNGEVQNVLTTVIGEENYDVGHLFHVDNDNGNAGFIASVCTDNRKGSAFSSALIPEGDRYDIDYVAHELGHQFGANHTWSFESENSGVQAEPASGTTIMGYAGIVEGNNVAPNGDDYFHYNSILQINTYLQTVSCAETSTLLNSPPTITSINDVVIPKGTAFVLEGNASDTNLGDVLTYAWEQVDDGVVTTATFGPNNVTGANFRSLPPSLDTKRFFPKLSRVVNGALEQINPETSSAWETVSTIERELNFALTVRDNAEGGGQSSSALVKVSVSNAAGPFVVTSQTASQVYQAGSVQEITWNVANTNALPVNAITVDVFLSTDGGLTFSEQIADAIPNTGLAKVQLPGIATTQARIMIKASDNVFYAVNSSDFTIEASDVVLSFDALSYQVCKPNDIIIPFVFETYNGFDETVTFSADAPIGVNVSFSPPISNTDNATIEASISGLSTLEVGAYPIEISATSTSLTTSTTIALNIFDDSFDDVLLLAPTDEATNTAVDPFFLWLEDSNSLQYDIEIATDVLFTTIVESATVSFNNYQSVNLLDDTNYFWRIRPKNSCGEGVFGLPFSFTTSVLDCKTFDTDEQPITIITEEPSIISSTITFVEELLVADINVNLEVSHTYLEDLIITLTSPSGTEVVLTSKSCRSLNNINVVFDDDGLPINCSGNPALQGVVQPLGSLSSFNGESILGDWVLTIEDTAASDGGSLDAFSLDVCVEGLFRPDDDEDGVFDDGDDLCLGTPKGSRVDTSGCAINDFPLNSFNIAIQSETCRQSNDGLIQISAMDTSITYTATISGNGLNNSVDFTETNSFQGLSAGTYRLCLTGTDGSIVYRENCFDVVINEPQLLMVQTSVINGTQQLVLELLGANLYTIEIDGVATQTAENNIVLNLKNGFSTLKVYTELPCQGSYEEQLFVSDGVILYPNPATEFVTVKTNKNTATGAVIAFFEANGQLVKKERYPMLNSEFDVNISDLSTGLYLVVITTENERQTFKLIKK